MNRYLTIHIPETAAPAPVSHFLRTQAGLTKKQISQAKFRPSGVQKNGQQCRVTETAYPGDQITVCLETDDVDSLHLESSSFTISSDSHSSHFPQTQVHILIPQLRNLQVLMPILIFTIHRLQRHSFFLSWRSCTKTRTFSQ